MYLQENTSLPPDFSLNFNLYAFDCSKFGGLALHLCDDGAIQSFDFTAEGVQRAEVLDHECSATSKAMFSVASNECIVKIEAWKNRVPKRPKLILTKLRGETTEYSGSLHGLVPKKALKDQVLRY